MANKGNKTAAEAQIRKAFNEMDTDGSGYLEPHELKQALAAIGCLTEEEVASIAKVRTFIYFPVCLYLCHKL